MGFLQVLKYALFHTPQGSQESDFKKELKKIAIVGSPNVGKSVLFNYLTGARVIVSNYPGTTVEVTRGTCGIKGDGCEVIDTPGLYSMVCITEEERVAKTILLDEEPGLILNVIDAKNISRMLPLTLQLIESGLPTILVLNIIDEADNLGIKINTEKLERLLNTPVVATNSVSGFGVDVLKRRMKEYLQTKKIKIDYGSAINDAVYKIKHMFNEDYRISKRAAALLMLQNDPDTLERVKKIEPALIDQIKPIADDLKAQYRHPLAYEINIKRQNFTEKIVQQAVDYPGKGKKTFRDRLSDITMNPWTGFPILLMVLYFGLYKFVGGFGAGTLVDFLESGIFEKYVSPYVTEFVERVIPWPVLQDLFVHDYGIITLGISYAIAIVFPIVGTFFLVFSLIEDSGYLPRLAMLIDRIFKQIGLSGRAVIPMVLGFGCDTMGTIVTRILPTKRERIIATLLLSLAIPCSAQLGVLLGLFSGKLVAFCIWLGVIVGLFLLVGTITARILPGEKSVFFMEIPPLRLPKLSNVLVKTYTRMEWYFKEVLPLFILASVLIWIGQITKVFDLILKAISYPLAWMGLPSSASVAFLFGFFRRDYGAAGLYDLYKSGGMTDNQLVIAAIVLTLFVPCVAQFAVIVKERGWKVGSGIATFVFLFALLTGIIVNVVFNTFGVVL